MSRLDPRHWNLVPPAALLLGLAACGPGGVGVDDSVGDGTEGDGDGDSGSSTGSSSSSSSSSTGDGDDDGGCETNSDCPPGYYCAPGGYCEYYWCGTSLPHEPGSVSRGPIHPACSPPYECYQDEDCGDGWVCEFGYCNPGPDPCEGLALVPLLIPDIGGDGPVLDLAFADFDADGKDELAVLRAGGLVLIDDGASPIELGPVDVGPTQITALRADDDEHLDLVLSDPDSPASSVWLGDGQGGFVPVSGGPQAPAPHATASDWPLGGAEELITHDAAALQIYAGLATDAPSVTEIPLAWALVDDLASGDWALGPGVVSSEAGTVVFYLQSGESLAFESRAELAHALAVGAFTGDGADDVVALLPGDVVSVLRLIVDSDYELEHGLDGHYEEPTALDLDADAVDELLVTGPDQALLLRFGAGGGPSCATEVADLPPASRLATGDLDDDGRDELALIDADGSLHLFTSG